MTVKDKTKVAEPDRQGFPKREKGDQNRQQSMEKKKLLHK